MMLIDSLKNNVQQLLGRSCTFCSPPEPPSPCFVQRTPENRNLCVLKSLQLYCDRINIPQCKIILQRIHLHSFSHIKVSVIGIEGACPKFSSSGREPMPLETNNPTTISTLVPFDSFCNGPIIRWLPIEPWIVRRVVLHIESPNHRTSADQSFELIVIICSLP